MKSSVRIHHCSRLLAIPLFILSAGAACAQSEPPKVINVPSLKPAANADVVLPMLAQLGIKPGSIHKIGVGLGVTKFRTIKIGVGGWVSFECIEANNAGWNRGEKYWMNMNTVTFVSAPFVENAGNEGAPAKKAPAKAESR
jgi:hypothetical protein